METPVLLIIFKRPELTRRALHAIAQARPKVLLVAADGPRTPEEKILCEQTRQVIGTVDWPCEVRTDYSDTNLGCGIRVHTAVDWALAQFEEVMILEDDCVPHRSFFRFCETLLRHYRSDTRVMHISGNNFQPTAAATQHSDSYYFSKYAHAWGWATWRRAWRHFDWRLRQWPQAKAQGLLEQWCETPWEKDYWRATFDAMSMGAPDVWDYQWNFAVWSQNGLVILPRVNLVSNHGWGPDATHTRGHNPFMDLETFDIGNIVHPPLFIRNVAADRLTFERNYGGAEMRAERGWGQRMKRFAKPLLRPARALKRWLSTR
ncbi:MAG: glycosyltransferase family 2 protein [Pseudomonadota bacterium]